MKLIDEIEIEEGFNNDLEYCSDQLKTSHLKYYKEGYGDGVEFAEQKLISLMLEFAKWCELHCSSRVFPDETILWNFNGMNHTTELLLEKFIKTKQNETRTTKNDSHRKED